MIKRLLILCLFAPLHLFAQFSDDFEDGDITNWTESNPGRWAASDISPLNGSYSLYHIFDNAEAGRDQISVQLPIIDLSSNTTSWRFKIKYDYNPSDGNNWSVFLVSNSDATEMFPGGNVNGYVLGVNFTGSDDILKLLKITSGSATSVITTSLDWDAVIDPNNTVALQITRSSTGDWEVLYNASGDFGNLTSVGTANDVTYTLCNYFGVYYDYTSSADQLLWIDDIEITGDIYTDNDAPLVDSFTVISNDELYLEFNEYLDSLSAVDFNNYIIDGNIGHPDSISIDEAKQKLQVFLSNQLTNGEYYNLTIQNVEDTVGNVIKDTSIQFLYYIPEKYDIVINEIMADPNPSVNLPDYEYVEIKNTTGFDIDLSGWKLKIGSSVRDFPLDTINSMAYVTLCSSTAGEFLDDYGTTIEFSSFPSITNSGTSIVIFDDQNNLIDSVSFSTDWYADDAKSDGGWSLERIDPLNTCSTTGNWKASEHADGGTPGTQNSVYASNIDNSAPQLEYLEIVSENQLKLIFDEAIVESTLLEKTNYSLNNGIGNPLSLIVGDHPNEINLIFLNSFPSEENLTLTIVNLEDECGNKIESLQRDFMFYKVRPYDIVINEIMIDPEPTVNLPEYEFVEIYNTTDYDIDLTNWVLEVGDSKKTFPNYTLASGAYLILCSDEAKSLFTDYGNVISFSSFPALPNSSQTIVLRDKTDQIISFVSYSDSWYQSDYKAEGGWTLEQIDPLNPCGGENNWIASESELGGTPGQINSVFDSNPDLDSPELLRITVIDNNTIQLFFNESVDSISAVTLTNYTVDNAIGTPVFINLTVPEYKSLLLQFADEFAAGVIYTLEIIGVITDCAGNEIQTYNSARFAIPSNPEFNDLVINEILFNPLPDGVDFVELYNKSDKTLDLKDLFIANYNYDDGQIQNAEQISAEGYLVFPGTYVVITENEDIVKQQYYTENPKAFAQINDLPSYNDDKGRVILMDRVENVIDDFEYDEDMHFALLATNEGVSLERINYNRSTADKTNWHSASELAGFATPAYQNSQYLDVEDIDDEVKIEPDLFSPDNDGFDDVTNIIFAFSEPGYVANIKIYDSRGRLVRYLANNQLLGVDGIISWDGLDENNQKAAVGIYVIYIELFDLDGNVKQFKKSVTVATKW